MSLGKLRDSLVNGPVTRIAQSGTFLFCSSILTSGVVAALYEYSNLYGVSIGCLSSLATLYMVAKSFQRFIHRKLQRLVASRHVLVYFLIFGMCDGSEPCPLKDTSSKDTSGQDDEQDDQNRHRRRASNTSRNRRSVNSPLSSTSESEDEELKIADDATHLSYNRLVNRYYHLRRRSRERKMQNRERKMYGPDSDLSDGAPQFSDDDFVFPMDKSPSGSPPDEEKNPARLEDRTYLEMFEKNQDNDAEGDSHDKDVKRDSPRKPRCKPRSLKSPYRERLKAIEKQKHDAKLELSDPVIEPSVPKLVPTPGEPHQTRNRVRDFMRRELEPQGAVGGCEFSLTIPQEAFDIPEQCAVRREPSDPELRPTKLSDVEVLKKQRTEGTSGNESSGYPKSDESPKSSEIPLVRAGRFRKSEQTRAWILQNPSPDKCVAPSSNDKLQVDNLPIISNDYLQIDSSLFAHADDDLEPIRMLETHHSDTANYDLAVHNIERGMGALNATEEIANTDATQRFVAYSEEWCENNPTESHHLVSPAGVTEVKASQTTVGAKETKDMTDVPLNEAQASHSSRTDGSEEPMSEAQASHSSRTDGSEEAMSEDDEPQRFKRRRPADSKFRDAN